MPVPALNSMADRYGVPLAEIEKFWSQAKAEYGTDWAAVMGATKKMCQNYSQSRGKALKK